MQGIEMIIIFSVVFLISLFIIALNEKTDRDEQEYKSKKRNFDNDTTIERSFWWHFRSDNDKKGEEGEDEVAEELRYIDKKFIVLRNINLTRKNNKPVQIDFLCVSDKGIFVIEVKNWLGEISGKYDDEIWISNIYDIENEQKNPVKQNEWHIEILKRFIKQKINFYSIIAFTDGADISKLNEHYNNSYIINDEDIRQEIYNIYKKSKVSIYRDYKNLARYLRRFAV